MRFWFFIIFVMQLMVLCSCNGRKEKVTQEIYPIISIDFRESKREVKTSEIIDTSSVQFIKLDTSGGLIGNVDKLIKTENEFIIMDKQLGAVWVFNLDGKYKTMIKKKGRGPNEYTTMHTITFKSPDLIGILDHALKHVIWYTTKGDYSHTDTLDYYACDIHYVRKMQYVFYRYISSKARWRDRYFFHVNHVSNNYKKRYFSYREPGLTSGIFDDFFIVNCDKCLIRMPNDNRLYKLVDDELVIAYEFDFGKNPTGFENIYDGKNFQGNISNVCFTPDHLTFQYSHKAQIASVVYSLKHQTIKNFKTNVLDGFNLYYHHPIATDSAFFYSIIYPALLWDSALEKLDLTGDKEIINPVIMKYQYCNE